MPTHRLIQGVALAAALVCTGACATGDPFARHARVADLKGAADAPGAVCDVEVINATGQLLDAAVELEGGVNRTLGLITSGRSVRLPVACRMGRVTATAVSQDWGDAGGEHFRAFARLDPLNGTVLRFTEASLSTY